MSKKKHVVAAGIGAGAGAWLGSGIGVAGAFGAVSGLLPVAVIGAWLGHKAYKASASESDVEQAARLRARREAIQAELTFTPAKRLRKGQGDE